MSVQERDEKFGFGEKKKKVILKEEIQKFILSLRTLYKHSTKPLCRGKSEQMEECSQE